MKRGKTLVPSCKRKPSSAYFSKTIRVAKNQLPPGPLAPCLCRMQTDKSLGAEAPTSVDIKRVSKISLRNQCEMTLSGRRGYLSSCNVFYLVIRYWKR